MLILRSISYGNHTMIEICTYSGMDKSMVSKHLDMLMSFGLIISEKPFGAAEKFKRRFYWIFDPYLKFWFRFILPHKSEIESSHHEESLKNIIDDRPSFAGEQFDSLIKGLILEGILDRSFNTISRRWRKNGSGKKGRDVEGIDIVVYSETREELLFAQCKGTNIPVHINIIEALKTKSETLKKQYPGKNIRMQFFKK